MRQREKMTYSFHPAGIIYDNRAGNRLPMSGRRSFGVPQQLFVLSISRFKTSPWILKKVQQGGSHFRRARQDSGCNMMATDFCYPTQRV